MICEHGNPAHDDGPFTDDQCYACWRRRRRGLPVATGVPKRGVCRYLGKRIEYRAGCGGYRCRHECEAGEPQAVPGGVCQTCPKWEGE